MWAVNNSFLRNLLVVFMEIRLGIYNPTLTLVERREKCREIAIAQLPGLNARLDRFNRQYVDAVHAGAPPERLEELENEVESLDTTIRYTQNGGMETVAAIVYLYYRAMHDSVGVGEQLGIKPPHVRQILHRLHNVWREKFNADGTEKPLLAPAPKPVLVPRLNAGNRTPRTRLSPGNNRTSRSPEIRAKISAALKGNQNAKGPRVVGSHLSWPFMEALAMRMVGLTWSQIDRKLGLKPGTVSTYFYYNGVVVPIIAHPKPAPAPKPPKAIPQPKLPKLKPVPAPKPPKPPTPPRFRIDVVRAAELRKTGMCWEDITKEIGATNHSNVFNAVKAAGLHIPRSTQGKRIRGKRKGAGCTGGACPAPIHKARRSVR